jgi:hypothetical protein
MEDTKPVLITWGFEHRTGDVYMGCYLELVDAEAARSLKPIYVRAQFTNEQVSLFHVPIDAGREDIESYVTFKPMRDEVITKLQKAMVRIDDIARKKYNEGNAFDFILGR